MGELQRDKIDRLFEVKTRDYSGERFSRLTGNSGTQYLQAWDELKRFANVKASLYFHDSVSREDAVDEAMSGEKDSAVAWLVKIHHNPEILEGVKNPWGYAKTIVHNRLKKLSKQRAEKRITKKDQIIELYSQGLRKADIARKLGCSKAHVTQVLKKVNYFDSIVGRGTYIGRYISE